MSFSSAYAKWSDLKKNVFILCVIAFIGSLVCIGFIFADNVGVLLGWLLGSAINLFSYITIAKGSSFILDPGDSRGRKAVLSSVFAILRLFLYAGGLVLAGFASFRWGTLSHGYCNLISLALAYMPTWIVLLIVTFVRGHKDSKPIEEKKKEDQE